jgi:hypothetical protein
VCRNFTPTVGPIVLKRRKGANYYLKSVCGACNSVKPFRHLNKLQVKAFPDDVRSMPENSDINVSEVPAELNPIIEPNPLIEQNAQSSSTEVKISDKVSQRVANEHHSVTSGANDIRDRIVDAIELLEANGFTVLVS